MRAAPEGAVPGVGRGVHLHPQPLHPDGVACPGGHGPGVDTCGQVMEAERAPLRHADRLEPGRDGPDTWGGEAEAVAEGL